MKFFYLELNDEEKLKRRIWGDKHITRPLMLFLAILSIPFWFILIGIPFFIIFIISYYSIGKRIERNEDKYKELYNNKKKGKK